MNIIHAGTLVTCLAAAVILPAAAAAPAEVDFLIPGVSLHSVDFTPGTSVSYLVISEVHGVRDTSLVSLDVTGKDSTSIALEVSSTSWPPDESESMTVRLTLCADAGGMSSPEEFYSCLGDIQVSSGGEPFREPSMEEIEDFDMGRLFLSRDEGFERAELERESVEVPAGTFLCDVVEYFRSDSRDVDMGGVIAKRFEEEKSILKMSPDVPFWGLVSSRVRRSTMTTYPGSRRPREAKPKVTVTESVLVDFSSPARENVE